MQISSHTSANRSALQGPLPCPALSRRAFLLASATAAITAGRSRSAAAADVAWLAEVQRPPQTSLPHPPRLAPVLAGVDGNRIESVEQWRKERERLRRAWLEFLGPMPAERPPVRLEVLREDKLDDCLRQLVRYESEPGQLVEGYLLRPRGVATAKTKSPGKESDEATNTLRAGIVALHATSHDHIHEIAGVTGADKNHLALKLAREGFVVFCPKCFLWQDRSDDRSAKRFQENVEQFKQRHPRTLGMHKMMYDAMRGVDVLASLSGEVDPQRIGAVGHSLGAKEAFYLAAFDDRVQATVASEGGIGFDQTNWTAPWYLGPGCTAEGFPLNHHQLIALIAPRPFLIVAGEKGPGAADGDRTWSYLEAALPAWRLYSNRPRLGLYNHGEGHTISPATWARMSEWLREYLAP